MTDTTPNSPTPKPQSIRAGSPKDIAISACNRKNYHVESFAYYLRSLEDSQQSIYQKKRPRQETLNQQMDILDAMFTYMAVHADWKSESVQSYSVGLRAQKQFCATLKEMKNLKLPKAPTAPAPTFTLDKK
jgi:hypothetical protein